MKVLKIQKRSMDRQLSHIKKFRKKRDDLLFEKAISALQEGAFREHHDDDSNLVPLILNAIRIGATTGEISNALREAYGEYHPSSFI